MTNRNVVLLTGLLTALFAGATFAIGGYWMDDEAILFSFPWLIGSGIAMCWLDRRTSRHLPRRSQITIWNFTAWLALLCLPAVARWGVLQLAIHNVPMPIDARPSIEIEPIASFHADFVLKFTTKRAASEMEQFYTDELASEGWTLVAKLGPRLYDMSVARPPFERSRYIFKRDCRTVQVAFLAGPDGTTVAMASHIVMPGTFDSAGRRRWYVWNQWLKSQGL